MTRPQKTTLGEMRASGIHGLLIYCADYKWSHSIADQRDFLSQSKSCLTSAPRLPQAVQVNRSARSDSRTSSGHGSALTDPVRALIVGAIDQQAAHAGKRAFGQGRFSAGGPTTDYLTPGLSLYRFKLVFSSLISARALPIMSVVISPKRSRLSLVYRAASRLPDSLLNISTNSRFFYKQSPRPGPKQSPPSPRPAPPGAKICLRARAQYCPPQDV
jgi:hypothetical protein